MGQHRQRLITRALVFLSLPTTSRSYFYSPSAYIKKATIEVHWYALLFVFSFFFVFFLVFVFIYFIFLFNSDFSWLDSATRYLNKD
jgi:hypothetical protein